jgi:RNA polymerase sigma-70 factor (ECF subfamily)
MNTIEPDEGSAGGDEIRVSGRNTAGLTALDELFREHHSRIYRAAYRVTGSSSDAEDVVQTIFLRIMKRDEDLVLGPSVASYLYRSAVNAALDLLRSRGRARAVGLDEAAEDVENMGIEQRSQAEARLEGKEMRQSLRVALAKMHPRSAEIFALRYFEGYGNTEIADMFDTSRSSIAVTLHRTRNRLKQELADLMGAAQ